MLKFIAVDDEWHALERFNMLAKENGGIDVRGLFETAAKAIDYLRNHAVDAVFLDIAMPEQKGLSLATEMLDIRPDIEIVFVTAYNEYAIEAFEISALDYILKPLTARRLQKTVDRIGKLVRPRQSEDKPYIRCFGSFALLVNGEAVTWRNSRALEALAFLVHKRGVPVSWDVLADALWSDYDSNKAQANFHSTMYLLRKRLHELGIGWILNCERGNYRIRTEMIRCDYYDFVAGRGAKPVGQEYMGESGYLWAYGTAAELDRMPQP